MVKNLRNMKNKTIKIPMHSLIDLITNSSTEIFVHSEKSLDACKELVNEFLSLMSSDQNCDDIFELSIETENYTVDNYKEWLRYEGENEDEEYDDKLNRVDDYLAGKIKEPEWWEPYHLQTKLVIKPKDKKYKKLAELFVKFLYSGDYFEYSND